jgi:pimeloyl-ACP methyl ester carboxylesterase
VFHFDRQVTFRGAGGVQLVGDSVGPEDGAPIVFLHGGGQTRGSWGSTAATIARSGFRAITLDHRGHGDSGWPEDGNYDLTAFAGDVTAVAAQLGRPPIVVGASLGGLAGLLAADALHALVLVDVAPRLEEEGVRRIIDFMFTGLDGFESLEAAADAIAAYLPHRKRPRDLSGLARNLRQGADGRWRWHWDPRFVRRPSRDPGFTPERLQAAARALAIPVLLVRGRMSDVVSEESVRELRELVPHAEYVDVAGASHMVAGDDNDAFSSAVVEFLRRCVPATPAASRALPST